MGLHYKFYNKKKQNLRGTWKRKYIYSLLFSITPDSTSHWALGLEYTRLNISLMNLLSLG